MANTATSQRRYGKISAWTASIAQFSTTWRDDSSLANVDLADRVNLSPSACLRRVRALERAGTIRGYRADIDPAALGRGFEVEVMVELTQQGPRDGRDDRGADRGHGRGASSAGGCSACRTT